MNEGHRTTPSSSLFEFPPRFEYGIAFERALDAPHRVNMTAVEAEEWVAEWVEMGGKPEAVSIIRRPIGQWERP